MAGKLSERVEELFHDALARKPEERAAFLVAACKEDVELLGRVRALLEHHDCGQEFLEEPALGPGFWPDRVGDMEPVSTDSREGERVGPYELRERIGEGGMGAVYVAERVDPEFRKRVAVKLIKRGMDTRAVVARFEEERKTLAMMDHPNIAQIFDAGSDEKGRPYFVMECVEGVAITEYCDRKRLGIRKRLEIFQQVCHGVHHAHLKTIIHRDIKPSNILVGSQDSEQLVKIIDFGVAKAIDHHATSRSFYTEIGQIIGTPAYMSPEQTELGSRVVDHRTDIYSLGVLLYELLVGELPLEVEKASYDDILRRIREEDPPTPSTRWSRLNAERTAELSEQRNTTSFSLRNELRGDLDWICVKAIDKEPARRYSTASELAADISRSLNNETVIAGPPGGVYRFRKFLRRNRGPVTATAAVLLVLVLGLVGSIWFALESGENARLAQKNLELAKKNEREAEQRATDVLSLSDVRILQECRKEAEELWPASSKNVTAMKSWLEKAEALVANLENHQATLQELRKRALPYNDARAWELAEVKRAKDEAEGQLKKLETAGRLSESDKRAAEIKGELVELEEKIAALAAKVSAQRTWNFSDSRDRWWHDTLLELVNGIKGISDPDQGTIANVKRRLEFARAVREKTIHDCQAKWDEAIASIANEIECPLYRGLKLKPQEGLIPLERDPDSGLWEFLHLQTGDRPKRDRNGRLVLTEETGLVLVLIPGGSFIMGAARPVLGVRPAEESDVLRIEKVVEDSLAERLGLKTGDVIMRVNEREIHCSEDLTITLSELRCGDSVTVTVRRGGRTKVLSSALGGNIDPQAENDEQPVHAVTLDAFFISKYEMTQGQWRRFAGEDPSIFHPESWDKRTKRPHLHPVEFVTWEMCRKVLGNLDLVLPTEAQWEYAARARTATVWWTGNERESLRGKVNLADQAIAKSRSQWRNLNKDWPDLDDGYEVHAEVGSFPANPFGLHEVYGNVSELCKDAYGSYTLGVKEGDGERQVPVSNARTDPRVVRGGSFYDPAREARSATRGNPAPTYRGFTMGVRPARAVRE